MNITSKDAKKIFSDLINAAKDNYKNENTENLPENFGEYLLDHQSTRSDVHKMLTKRRKEGVRDQDILWWWNLNELERQLIRQIDDTFRVAMLSQYIEQGKSQEEAAEYVRKLYPIYGDPEDTTQTKDDNRPLPFELKDRVNKYIEYRISNDYDKFQNDIDKSSTLNALIRSEIQKGNL
jgi:hypothetical protein